MKKTTNDAYFAPAIAHIDLWLERMTTQDDKTPGYVIAISHHGKIIYNRAFGTANLESGEAMTPEHIFRIGSHSKTFTATAIMHLAEAGKLSITDRVSQYLPYLTDNADTRVHDMTIQELMSHSAGLSRDSDNAAFWLLEKAFPSQEILQQFMTTQELIIDGRVQMKYSNIGYGVLAEVIEAISGQSYHDYIQKNIFEPLNLTQISTDYDPDLGVYPMGYTDVSLGGHRAPISPNIPTNALAAATGFCANAATLCQFFSALMPKTGQLLTDRSKREMQRHHWSAGKDYSYGLGTEQHTSDNQTFWGHGGAMQGMFSRTVVNNNQDMVVTIMANAHNHWNFGLSKGIYHILNFYKKTYKMPSPYESYRGVFRNIWGETEFVPMGNKIYSVSLTATKLFEDCIVLKPEGGHRFKITNDDEFGSEEQIVEFIMSEDGHPEKVIWAGSTMIPYNQYEEMLVAQANKPIAVSH